MGGMIINQAVVLAGDTDNIVSLNTLFGIVIALAVIVLIMLITYFANIKPNLNANTSGNTSDSSSGSVSSQPVQIVEEELVDDGELVAVITAAIYASMGDAVPADGFVVRSIRKVNAKRWMNA